MKYKPIFHIDKKLASLFIKDIYKDIRKIEVLKNDGENILRRYSDTVVPIEEEANFLRYLNSLNKRNWKLPEIINISDDYIDFKYIKGIRLFNFLIELRYLYLIEHSKNALEISELIKEITIDNLKNFQSIISNNNNFPNVSYYPLKEKLLSPIILICNSSSFKYNLDEVIKDLEIIEHYYNSISSTLFRDATPKNIIFDEPLLYYKNFIDDTDRRNTIRNMVNSGYFTKNLLQNKLFHIDFTGCKYLCPTVDDFIAANLHESNFWIPSSQFYFNENKDDINFLITLFVRYLRFGGRKLSYRIYNSIGHKIRFRFDFEKMYFTQLKWVTKKISEIIDLKGIELIKIFSYMESLSDINIKEDYISKFYDISDIIYYSGLFPEKKE